jgi:hypothetical protein
MGLNILSTLQNIGKVAAKGQDIVLRTAEKAGAKSGIQGIGTGLLKTAGRAGQAVGARSPTLRSAGKTVTAGFDFLGAKTPQDVGQLFAGSGKFTIGGKVFTKGATLLEKDLINLGLKAPSGALTKKGIQTVASGNIKGLSKATVTTLEKKGLVTAKGTLTTAVKKELITTPAKTGKKQIEQYILSAVGTGGQRQVARGAERALTNAIVRKTESTGVSGFTKLLAAGVLGAGAVTVPVAAYVAGKQQGAAQNEEQLLKEAELYEQGQQDVYSTLGSQQGEDIPLDASMYDYPLYDGQQGASIADPAYFPNYGYSAPSDEIIGNDLLDSGSNPLILADYSNTPDEVQDIDMSVYGLENIDNGSEVILETLPEDLQMTEFDDSLIEEDTTDIFSSEDLIEEE